MSAYKDLEAHLSQNKYKWLLTGCGGFIGSNLLERLLILEQEVVGVDNFSTGFKENIDDTLSTVKETMALNGIDFNENNFVLAEADIEDLKTCQDCMKGVDFVLHQAALGSIPRSINNPINSHRSNVNGFLNILNSAKESGIKSFVFASSSSVYGDSPILPKSELNIGNPLSPYAATKLINEIYSYVFKESYDFPSIGLRYFNVFGKRQSPHGDYAAVIPKWIRGLLDEEEIFINGDGSTSRDFCYVENVIQANLLATFYQKELKERQIFNVACGERTTLNELFSYISDLLLKENKDLIISPPKYLDFREGDVLHSLADIGSIKNKIGFQPSHDIYSGLEETISWYLRQH